MPLTFKEAVEFAASRRVALPSEYYGDLQGAKRNEAFTVAGVAQREQLQAVMDSLNKVLGQGVSFKDWKEMVRSGEIGLDLPEYRLNNIFRTNMQTAYNHGHYEQQQRNKGTRPYLMYDAVNDSRTRPSHLAMDNIIRPVDDPFWEVHYPPNGYQCRCTTISLTEAQARARGGVTGEPKDGWPSPDKGWDYNPGASPETGIQQALGQRPNASEALQSSMERAISDADASIADIIDIADASHVVADLNTLLEEMSGTKEAVLDAMSTGRFTGATEPITVREAQDFAGSAISLSALTTEEQALLRLVSDEARVVRGVSLEIPADLGIRGPVAKQALAMSEDVFATLQIPGTAEAPVLYRIPPRGTTEVRPDSVKVGTKTYHVGEVVTQRGFMSAFAKEPMGVETTMFVIEPGPVSSAVPVSFISATPAELEWMFIPDTKFLVDRIEGEFVFLKVQP